MSDGNSKKSKLSWSKKMVRKWFFNIKGKAENFQADVVYGGWHFLLLSFNMKSDSDHTWVF
uniref:Uncharacterized protein n=1 Tax=Rhizophora mucronata TaxID=61149 RepID=A0A2P2N5L8_RHIMU